MTVTELREVLRWKPVPDDAYSLDDGTPDEAYVLLNEGAEWTVFYSERGLRTEERRFTGEDAACAELLSRLGRDFRFDDA